MLIILVLGKLRLKDLEFSANLVYKTRFCPNLPHPPTSKKIFKRKVSTWLKYTEGVEGVRGNSRVSCSVW